MIVGERGHLHLISYIIDVHIVIASCDTQFARKAADKGEQKAVWESGSSMQLAT